MTQAELNRLPKGARVKVRESGKVYQVTFTGTGRTDRDAPNFREVKPRGGVKRLSPADVAADLDGQPARLSGSAFVKLKPENVDLVALDPARPVLPLVADTVRLMERRERQGELLGHPLVDECRCEHTRAAHGGASGRCLAIDCECCAFQEWE